MQLDLTFDYPITVASGAFEDGFTVNVDAAPVAISASGYDDVKATLDVPDIYVDQVVTLDYAGTNLETSVGGKLAAFSGQVVVNNSTVTDPLLVHDTFTDVNGTLLQNHTPDVGGPWVKHDSHDVTIQDNEAESQAQVNTAVTYAIETGQSDVRMECNIMAGTEGGNPAWTTPGMGMRIVDEQNLWIVGSGVNNTTVIQERDAGVETTRASDSNVVAHGELMVATAIGSTITLQVAAHPLVTYALATFQETVTAHGIRAWYNNDPRPRIDNLRIEIP